MSKTIRVKGTREVNKAVKQAKKRLSHKEISSIFQQGAEMMENETQRRIPKGDTGNLRNATVVREMSKEPVVFIAGIDRKVAPHSHLIEYGTGARYHKSGKYVGEVEANPYFRPAYDSVRGVIENHIVTQLRRRVERG